MKRTFLLLSAMASPCWADSAGGSLIVGFGGILSAWLLSPLAGIAITEFGGMRAKGCSTMLVAYAVGVLASTASLMALHQIDVLPYELVCILGALAGAGTTLWVIYRSRQRDSGDSQS
jgi:hypothetical protein